MDIFMLKTQVTESDWLCLFDVSSCMEGRRGHAVMTDSPISALRVEFLSV